MSKLAEIQCDDPRFEREIPKGRSWVTLIYHTEKDMRTDAARWLVAGWTMCETKDLQVTYSYPNEEPPLLMTTYESAVVPAGSS